VSPWFGHPYFHNAEKCLDVTNSKSQSRISDFATCTQFKNAVRQLVTTKYDVIYKTSPCVAQSSVLSVCDVGVLRPNGWMDQDGTRHWGRPWDQPHCVRWGPSFPPPQRDTPPIFGPCLFSLNSWLDQDATWYGGKPRPRRHCVRWGPISPKKGGQQHFLAMSIVAKRLDGSRYQLVRR